jgi:O-methyltransferase involved in polyketide biosynthesis
MSKITLESQNVVAETLLTTLYARAVESQLPAPLLRDDYALALVEKIDYDFSRLKLQGHDQVTTIMRLREFDRRAQDFLARHPDAIVVHIGCGLDTRFERICSGQAENGQVEWYDLDLPEVIELRRKLIDESPRCHYLGYSVFDLAWLDAVSIHAGRPFLFLAEGVLPYCEESEVRGLVLLLKEVFPGAELVCDAMTPFMIRLHNLKLIFSKVDARLHWSLKHGRDLESWGADIHLLDEWFYFDRPEPRLGASQLMHYFPPLAKGVGVFHYRLGNAGPPAGLPDTPRD